jgi:glycosyltransferase involved in cell wall biosynthesis
LFDTLAAVALASQRLRQRQARVSLRLLVTGGFVKEEEKAEFDLKLAEPGMADIVQYLGFVSGEQKHQLLREADLFCFPTYYENENQPVNLIEAMAFGLPIVTTRWRSLPEMLPPDYPGLVSGQNPYEIAAAILRVLADRSGERVRKHFCERYTLERHLADLATAIRSVEQE